MSAAFFAVPLVRLVEALAVERQRRPRPRASREPARRRGRGRRLGDAAQACDVLRRELAHARLQRLEAARCARRCRRRSSQPSHSITCSMPWNSATSVPGWIAGAGRRRRRSRCGADRRRRSSAPGSRAFASSMRRNRIGCANAVFEPAMNRQSRVVEVVVAARRRVGAERRLVAGDRARHAQARVGVDVVGADEALGELVEDVVVLGQELAGDVERDGVGAVLAMRGGEAVGERGRAPRPSRSAAAARRARCAAAAAAGASASSPRGSPSGAACCPCCTGARSWRGGRDRRARR